MAQTDGQTDKDAADVALIPQHCWGAVACIGTECIKKNLLDIEKQIAPCKPKIIGVTKYYGLDAVVSGFEAGLRDFGESRALESIAKIESLPEIVRQNSTFHFIGHLQTNKVEKVVKYYDYIHSVDSLKLAGSISKAIAHLGKEVKVLIQVNNACEEQKSGYSKEGLMADMHEILKLNNLELVGLMNIAPLNANEHELRRLFKDMADFKKELEMRFGIKLKELSMGMSDDYKIAVAEGATMIRIGRKLFT